MHLRRLLSLVFIGVIAAGVVALASGRIAYVSTSGVSMEPTYSAGDLVLVSRDGDYGVGDAVAYRDPGTGATVLHRIVEDGGADGYALRGDTNESLDEHRPTADELAGRAVLHVPHLGGLLAAPATKAVLVLILAGLFGSLALPTSEDNHPMSHRRSGTTASRSAPDRVRTLWRAALALDVVLLVAVVGAFALRPAGASPAPDEAALVHLELGYRAEVPRSETYPDGRIETGDTIFRSLTDTVEVFAHVAGPSDVTVDGFVRLDLTVSSSAGWDRSLPLVGRTALDDELQVAAPVTFADVDRIAERIAAETGVSAGSLSLTVALTGEARVDGGDLVELDGELPLRLDADAAGLADVETTDGDDGPVMATTAELALPADGAEDAGDQRPDLTRPALAALLLAAGVTAVTWPTDDDDVLRIRTTSPVPHRSTSTIEVAHASEVERIARHIRAPILCRDDGWQGVVDGDTLYWAAPRTDDG